MVGVFAVGLGIGTWVYDHDPRHLEFYAGYSCTYERLNSAILQILRSKLLHATFNNKPSSGQKKKACR